MVGTQGTKKDRDELCFSIVFKSRTLDFAADRTLAGSRAQLDPPAP